MSKIKILNSSLVEQGIINNTIFASCDERINSDNTLQFVMSLTEQVMGLIIGGNIAELDSDYFDIVTYKKGQFQDGTLTASVECEHVSYRLNNSDYDVEYFASTGTPTAVLTDILAGTGFTTGTVEFTDPVTYSAQESKSRRQLLMEFVAYLGGEIDYNQFAISILDQRGSSTPKNLTAGRNFEILEKHYNKREKDKLGNPLISYVCKLIKPMAIELGDVVELDYSVLEIDATLRVVSISKNPYNSLDVDFEIGNFIPMLQDDFYRIETQTVTKDKLYYGARIGPEFGFESVRSDKKARGYFNADGFALQKGDGTGGNWENALYANVNGELVLIGYITCKGLKNSNGEAFLTEDGLKIKSAMLDEIIIGGGDVDLGAGYEIYDDKENPTIHITKDLIDVINGKIRIRDGSGNSIILDQYGLDARFIKWFKNMCYNSSFEVFDDDNVPDYWSGGVSDANSSFFGSYSMKLNAGQTSTQEEINGCGFVNPQWYNDISTKTRVSFHKKGGSVKISVLDGDNADAPFTLTDEDGNTGAYIEYADNANWEPASYTVYFTHGESTEIKVKFENSDVVDMAYIDAIIIEPDYTGKRPSFYTDGPASVGNIKGKDLSSISDFTLVFSDAYNDEQVNATSETILPGIDVTFKAITKVVFGVQIDVTASEAMTLTIKARIAGQVHRQTVKYFSGAYKDQIVFNGMFSVVEEGLKTVDFTITPSNGTATIAIGEYRLTLTVRDGSAQEAPLWPTANVRDTVDSFATKLLDSALVVKPGNVNQAVGDTVQLTLSDGVEVELT